MRDEGTAVPTEVFVQSRGSLTRGDGFLEVQ